MRQMESELSQDNSYNNSNELHAIVNVLKNNLISKEQYEDETFTSYMYECIFLLCLLILFLIMYLYLKTYIRLPCPYISISVELIFSSNL